MAGITGTELARCRLPCGPTTPGINVGNGQLQKGVRGDFRPARPQLIQETDSRLASLLLPTTGFRHSIIETLPQRFTVMDANADAIKDYIAQHTG